MSDKKSDVDKCVWKSSRCCCCYRLGQPSESLLFASGFFCIPRWGNPVLAMPLKDAISVVGLMDFLIMSDDFSYFSFESIL